MSALPAVCYLCGQPLEPPIGWDHVPPRQFFAAAVRKAHNLSKLLTIAVHDGCNKAYQLDEDYFVHTLMPFARGSYSGQAIYNDVLGKFRRGQKVGLTRRVLKEFEPRPSGLVLPGNKVIKRFQGARVQRVAWKIVRGLYFHHHGIALPEHHTTWVSVTPPDQLPPEHFRMFMSLPNESHGLYPGVFAYRFDHFIGPQNTHYWALLLWDRIIITIIFHDPACACDQCEKHNEHKLG